MAEVRISKELFNALYRFHVCGNHEDAAFIEEQIREKMDKHISRILYTQYKKGDTDEMKESAWQAYVSQRDSCRR